MKLSILLFLFTLAPYFQQYPDAYKIMGKVDQNSISGAKIMEGRMIIYGKRHTREMSFRSYTKGKDKSFTEYLSPAREKGTKMLKLEKNLWIYSPSADRTIQLSGHMLKQSMMGSDLSYDDMMQDRKLSETYDAKVTGKETIDGNKCWVIELNAKVEDVSYSKMKVWVDEAHYVPLKEEMYAKSGSLLKLLSFTGYKKSGNYWYATKMNFKDVLKNGKGTDFMVDKIEFDAKIDAYIFSKAALKK